MVNDEMSVRENGFVAEDHQAFLGSLATDEGLRAEIARDPSATLARFGIRVSADTLPSEISLPSAEAIRAVLASTDTATHSREPCDVARIA